MEKTHLKVLLYVMVVTAVVIFPPYICQDCPGLQTSLSARAALIPSQEKGALNRGSS